MVKVKRILKIFYKEFTSINQAALLLGLFTFFSQILALVRDRLFASQIGVGGELDIYYTAFRIPDIVFAIAASLVSVTILIPFFIESGKGDTQDTHKNKQHFVQQILSAFTIGMIGISVLVFFLMPFLAKIIAPGFDVYAIHSLVKLSRIMLLSPILLGFSNLFGMITQANKRFFVYAIAPVFYNLGIILGVILLYPMFGVTGLAWGVVIGACMHMGIQLPVVLREGYMLRFSWSIDWKNIWRIVSISLPRTLTLSMSKIIITILVALASTLPSGSVTIFNFAWNLQNVPLALIGMSFSVAAFPTLVQYFTDCDYENFLKQIIAPARQIIFWAIPVTVFFIVLRAHIVRVILGTGVFSWNDTRLTAAALALFVLSIMFQSLTLLLVRGYYAAGKTWRPFMVTMMSSVVTIVSAFLFLHIFQTAPALQHFTEEILRVPDLTGTPVLVLAFAYSFGEIIRFMVMGIWFYTEFMRGYSVGLRRVFFQSLFASFVMGFVIYELLRLFDNMLDINTFHGVFLQGFFSGVMGIVALVVVLKLIKNEEINAILHALHARGFWNNKVIGSGDGEVL